MRKIELQEIPLQPLQIPTGWNIVCNQFFDIEPGEDVYINGLPDGDAWELFLQDMLLIHDNNKQLHLDLGWQPEADPSGKYILTLVRNEDWSHPIAMFESLSKNDIVDKINLWLHVTLVNDVSEIDLSYDASS
jgi:hypothetical protein